MNSDILKIALSQYGIIEIPSKEKNSPDIMRYFNDIGHKWVKDDETAWCSAFINWVALKAGCEKSDKLDARSWLKVGEVTLEPEPGDIVIFWRVKPDSWKGHVSIYINKINDAIYCLGGNQGNMVQVSSYPAGRLLGYRKLKKI